MKLRGWGKTSLFLLGCFVIFSTGAGRAQSWTHNTNGILPQHLSRSQSFDSLQKETDTSGLPKLEAPKRSAWGIDILLSNNGFGLGGFYRKEYTEDLSGFVTFSISEAKDDREFEMYDPYLGTSYTPGKLNRFLVLPLMAGVQYRLFREDIMDSFRPYVNAGAGPTMIYASPYTEISGVQPDIQINQVEFFKSLGRGRAHYTAGAFVGFGANFGTEKSSLFGINIRYYFTYLLGDGLPSLYDISTGGVAATKKDFGGFFITFNIGVGY